MARNRYRFHTSLALLTVLCLIVLVLPALALANPGAAAPSLTEEELRAATAQKGEPIKLTPQAGIWETFTVEITDLAPGKEPTLLVRGFMKKGVKKPVVVGIPVPDESTVIWAGEIFGSDPSKDMQRKIAIEQKKGYRLVEFTADHSPYAQVEMTVPKGIITKTAEGKYRFQLGWIPEETVGKVRLGVHVPAGFRGEKPSKGVKSEVKPDGSSFWYAEFTSVTAQREISIAFDLEKGNAVPPATSATPDASPAVSGTATSSAAASSTDATRQPTTQSLVTAPPAPPAPRTMLLIVSVLLLLVFGGVFAAVLLRQGGLAPK